MKAMKSLITNEGCNTLLYFNLFQTLDEYALEFSSTSRDIVKVTDLTFYPDLSYQNRTKLLIAVHSDIW